MNTWRNELRRFLLILAAALVFGLLVGEISFVLLIALAGYSGYNLLQLRRLTQWVAKDSHKSDT